MAPVVLTLLQVAFLVLLYVFVARTVRAVLHDIQPSPPVRGRRAAAAAAAGTRTAGSQRRRKTRPAPGELVVHLPDERPRVIALSTADVTFGRHGGATVQLSDPYVSEHHAKIYRDGDDWYLADMGSTNGTFLNKAKVTSPTVLAAGDQVSVGKTVVEVRR